MWLRPGPLSVKKNNIEFLLFESFLFRSLGNLFIECNTLFIWLKKSALGRNLNIFLKLDFYRKGHMLLHKITR